ncbi:MAG: twin-arginine translocation signal domain-containing protein, partial [Verrucomicrobiota bacterium]
MTPDARPPGLGSSRRDFVRQLGAGFGAVALGQLLARDQRDQPGRLDPKLLGRRPHHPPRARRVIQLFMNGGASQM